MKSRRRLLKLNLSRSAERGGRWISETTCLDFWAWSEWEDLSIRVNRALPIDSRDSSRIAETQWVKCRVARASEDSVRFSSAEASCPRDRKCQQWRSDTLKVALWTWESGKNLLSPLPPFPSPLLPLPLLPPPPLPSLRIEQPKIVFSFSRYK